VSCTMRSAVGAMYVACNKQQQQQRSVLSLINEIVFPMLALWAPPERSIYLRALVLVGDEVVGVDDQHVHTELLHLVRQALRELVDERLGSREPKTSRNTSGPDRAHSGVRRPSAEEYKALASPTLKVDGRVLATDDIQAYASAWQPARLEW
jgi:hypothetical protein